LVCSAKEPIKEDTPMALDESALPELLDALRAGDGVNLIRDAVRMVI